MNITDPVAIVNGEFELCGTACSRRCPFKTFR